MARPITIRLTSLTALCAIFSGGSPAQSTGRRIPPNMFPVKAVTSKPATAGPSGGGKNLRIAKGQYFSYALPEGWRVGEDGQFALTLLAPDNKALTIMVGNAGLPR